MIIKKVMPKIPVAKKRVAAYCRVSTFRNEQDESFETQQKYYEELIQSHPDWELVKVYADRHSATRVKNRPGFQEMAAAAEAKKLDIIIAPDKPNPSAPSRGKGDGSKEYISPSLAA